MEKNIFEILRFLCENGGEKTQRIISEGTGISLGMVNQVINKLKQAGYISEEYQVSKKGLQAMDPFKVKNAIILAAGMSTRFIPFSYEIPKG